MMIVKYTAKFSPFCMCQWKNSLNFKPLRWSSSKSTMNIFDKKTKILQRERAASQEDSNVYDYLKVEVAKMLLDRVADVKRTFPSALDLGCGKGIISELLCETDAIHHVTQFENSEKILQYNPHADSTTIVGDEEALPFQDNSFDLVLSNLNLHWENRLPQVLKEIKRVLKPDGCLLGAVYGMDTLFELRCALQLAETEREGGMGVRVSPMIQGHQLSSLLFNAGYSMVTLDYDELVVRYPSMFEVMRDLQGMGENNATQHRRILHRDTLLAASSIYQAMYGGENYEDGVPASFQILFMIGWKPDKSQPKPLKPGAVPKGFNVKDGN